MTDWASPEAVEAAMDHWSDGQRDCRLYGHNWRAHTVTHRPGQYTVTQRCPRCRVRRWKLISEQGYSMSPWHPDYSNATGYLLKGVGRLGVEGKAVLTLDTFVRLGVIEEPEDETA